MASKVFVFENEKPTALLQRPYRDMAEHLGVNLESALQKLLADYPELFPGWEIKEQDPPRFVTLCEEARVKDWSLDVLLVDQYGVLTLVEAKLAENREMRRQVIGQIVEYAAHAKEDWADGKARTLAIKYYGAKGQKFDDIIHSEFSSGNPDFSIDGFWNLVENNLSSGKIRLVIAVDEFNDKITRDIEYLNSEMKNAQVYCLELRCFAEGPSRFVVVPTLFGSSREAIERKEATLVDWTPEKLKENFDSMEDRELATRLLHILNLALENKMFIRASAMYPGFGLAGKKGKKFVGISYNPSDISKTTFFCFFQPNYFASVEQRDQFIKEVQLRGLLDSSLSPEQVKMGRMLNKPIREMTYEELNSLMEVFSKFGENP